MATTNSTVPSNENETTVITINVNEDDFNQATILLNRAHGVLDLMFTLACSNEEMGGLCKGSTAASLDAVMTLVSTASELLLSGTRTKEVFHA